MKIDLQFKSLLPRQLPGWKSSLLALLLVWASSFTPFIASIDAIFYDFYIGRLPSASANAAKILLIEADYDLRASYTNEFETLTRKVFDNGAAQVVFLFSPTFTPDFSSWASTSHKIVLGLPAVNDPASPDGFRITDTPSTALQGVPKGLVLIDPRNHGIYSTQRTTYALTGEQRPTIEVLAARQMGRTLNPNETYWINFAGGLASLPRLPMEQALKGNIVPELVKGRSILIGLRGGNAQTSLNFPGGAALEASTPNEFHAFAVNTLLSHKEISPLTAWQRFMLLSVFTFLIFMAYQPVLLRYIVRLSLALGAGYGLLTWVLLSYFGIWLPLTEMITLHVVTLGLVYRSKGLMESQRLERMLVETSAKLHDRMLPASFTNSQEHWSYSITMVEQILSLNRIIFLERIPGDHRVREIKSIHCDLQDIDEKRRDYERTPYTTALTQQSPLEVKNYLKKIEGIDERQFLVPLVFGGEVLGFWAFGILASKLTSAPAFVARVEALGEQVSLLLYQRKIHQEREQGEKRNWGRYLADRQSAALSELRSAIALQDKRMESLEHVFRDLATAAILYDFFGRVVLVNDQMHRLLQAVHLNPYQLTAVDMITVLTGKDRDTVRNYIQFTVFEGKHMSLHASIGEEDQRQCLLSFRAIGKDALTTPGDITGDEPFQSDGLLVELVDISEFNRIQQAKFQLVERLKYLFHNDIAALLTASALLKNPNLNHQNKELVLSTIDAKISSASDALNKTLGFLSEDQFARVSERYPVNALESLHKAIENCREIAVKRRIVIETALPRLISFAMASQQEIGNAFQAILDYLLDDTIEDGKINISMSEQGRFVLINFENSGMGIPQAKMDEFLFGHNDVSSMSFRRLRDTLSHVKLWGGDLKVTSHVGEGVRFNLTLEAFM